MWLASRAPIRARNAQLRMLSEPMLKSELTTSWQKARSTPCKMSTAHITRSMSYPYPVYLTCRSKDWTCISKRSCKARDSRAKLPLGCHTKERKILWRGSISSQPLASRQAIRSVWWRCRSSTNLRPRSKRRTSKVVGLRDLKRICSRRILRSWSRFQMSSKNLVDCESSWKISRVPGAISNKY